MHNTHGGRKSGTATRYGLKVPGFSPGEDEFSAPVHVGPGAYPASFAMDTSFFPGSKEAGTWR